MTRLVTPFVPGLEIDQRFALSVNAQLQNLSAMVLGPAAQVVRYEEPQEQDLGELGQYDKDGELIAGSYQTAYEWPGLATGGEIDEDFTRVHIKNALLKYWNQPSGTMVFDGINKISHPSKNFVTNGAYAAHTDFGDREVQVGDRVMITGELADTSPFSLATYVQGFSGEMSAASVDPAEAVSSNVAAIAVDVETVVAGGSNTGNATLAADAAAYNGYGSGVSQETYSVTVIQGSTGGDLTTARLSVTSASGLDNVSVVIPAAYATPFAIGTRGLTATFTDGGVDSDLVVGETWTIQAASAYAIPAATVSGSFTASDETDRTYLVEVISGDAVTGSFDVRISALSGNDKSATFTLTDTGAGTTETVAVGSYGVQISFDVSEGMFTGDKWLVVAHAAKTTNMRTLVLAHSLPATVPIADAAAAALDVSLYIMDDIELPRRSETPGVYNFTSHAAELRVKAGVTLKHSEWTVGGNQVALPLETPAAWGSGASVLYATYRAWAPASATLLSVSDPADLDTLVPGPIDPDNPLKYGLSKALLTNGGRPVYWFNVGNPNVDTGWSRALQAADDTKVTYGFVPLTRRQSVLDLVAGHVDSRSGARFNMYRVAWLTTDDILEASVVDAAKTTDGEFAMATITDDPNQTGTQYTMLAAQSGNVAFNTVGVRPGDRVRYGFATDAWGEESYDEYVIDRVINESTLILVDGPTTSESVGRRFEIHRTLTPGERVEAFQASTDSIKNKYAGFRFRVMAFSNVYDGTKLVPSYYMAAVLAAARSNLAPHQPMTRYAVAGFSGVKDIDLFSAEQLNELAASGGFIVSPDISSGFLRVRHAVTAGDWDDVNQREESIISNIDSMNFYMFEVLDPYIGRANAVDDTIAAIKSDLKAAGSYLQSANFASGLGGQLTDLVINSVRPSPLAKDTVLIDIEYLVPGPVNRIRVALLVR